MDSSKIEQDQLRGKILAKMVETWRRSVAPRDRDRLSVCVYTDLLRDGAWVAQNIAEISEYGFYWCLTVYGSRIGVDETCVFGMLEGEESNVLGDFYWDGEAFVSYGDATGNEIGGIY